MKNYKILLGVMLMIGMCTSVVVLRLPASTARASTRKVVASKGEFVLGLRDNGTVFCVNMLNIVCNTLPVNLSNVVDIDAGETHGIALKSDGTVTVWGLLTADDQLNGGVSYAGISAITNAVAIAGGAEHTLILLADGTLRCFGNNNSNRCSGGDGLTSVIDIDAADRWSMALLADGRTVVWGRRLVGGVAVNPTPFGSSTIEIAMSDDYYFQLLDTGRVDVLQAGTYGDIESTTNVIGMAAGYTHFMALRGNGTTACWYVSSVAPCMYDTGPTPVSQVVGMAMGDSLQVSQQADGQLQIFDFGGYQVTPVATERVGFSNVLTAGGYAVVRRGNGSAFTWGLAQVPTITAWSNIKQLSGYGNTLLGLTAAGTVQSATLNGGTTTLSSSGSNIKAIARGRDFSAFLYADGTFSSDIAYDIVDGATYNGRAKALCAGRDFIFLLSADGTVHLHGNINPNYDIEAIPASATNIKQIACGENHIIALRADGTTIGWGNIPNGQSSATNVRAVAASGLLSAVLYADGTVAARGYDDAAFNAFLLHLHNVRDISVGTYQNQSNQLLVQFVAIHDNGKLSVFGNAATQVPTPYAMTYTRTYTPSRTATPTRTHTATHTATRTYTVTATSTNTATATATRTSTPTPTNTSTATVTYTDTATHTTTNTRTETATITQSNTRTPSHTQTASPTVTDTRTQTASRTSTSTMTSSRTATPSNTNTPTRTFTASRTATNSSTATNTRTPTSTRTETNTATSSRTFTASRTATNSSTATDTRTATNTRTPTSTRTETNTRTNTATRTYTRTYTASRTPTSTRTPTNTTTSTQTMTPSITQSATSTTQAMWWQWYR